MRLRSVLRGGALGAVCAVWMLACVATVAAQAEDDEEATPLTVGFSGRLSAESRGFPAAPAFPAQRSLAAGAVAEATLYVENVNGQRFTAAPFFRYDHTDSRRTHFDLREAYLLLFGDVGGGGWEARLGVGQVSWGVAESQPLVDIVNQVDFVEHPGGEAKLGQPMAHVTWFGEWGTLEVLGMSYHRARTFPGRRGRLRLPVLVEHENVQYDGAGGRWRPEVASRYSHSLGLVDLGATFFDGTSREPFFFPAGGADGEPVLIQHYAPIRQFGADLQVTAGAGLLKAEAIQRSGARNLLGLEQAYFASVFGGEYSLYAVGGSAIDVTLLGEWSYDSRGPAATPSRTPNTLENDVFIATRFAFNDVQSTEFTASVLLDASRANRLLALEFGRRLSNDWSVRAEGVAILSLDERDIFYEMRRDSFIDMSLVYNF